MREQPSDADEGTYTWAHSGDGTIKFAGRVEARASFDACVDTSLEALVHTTLCNEDGELFQFHLVSFAVSGLFPSEGDTEAVCPSTPPTPSDFDIASEPVCQ